LSVCPENNSKTKYLIVFKLGIGSGMTFGYPTSGMVLGVERAKVKVRVTVK